MNKAPASEPEFQEWCRWTYGLPQSQRNVNPLRGGDSDQKQNHPDLYFLAGTDGHLGGEALQRKVKVPVGKALILPVISTMYSIAEFPHKNVNELLADAKVENKSTRGLKLIIDNVPDPNPQQYLLESTAAFNISLPNDNILEVNPGNTQAIFAAYPVKLTTTAQDRGHTCLVQFGGDCAACGFATNVRYQVSIF
jgi:hypothetical protein